MSHPALVPGAVAVVTGGAAGIGLASAARFARLGMKVCIADLGAAKLAEAATVLTEAAGDAAAVITMETDVSDRAALAALEAAVTARFGGTDVLMNNAGITPASSRAATSSGRWRTGSGCSRSTSGASCTAPRCSCPA